MVSVTVWADSVVGGWVPVFQNGVAVIPGAIRVTPTPRAVVCMRMFSASAVTAHLVAE
jgi:hypothetical protein